jgi:hypothetical protein
MQAKMAVFCEWGSGLLSLVFFCLAVFSYQRVQRVSTTEPLRISISMKEGVLVEEAFVVDIEGIYQVVLDFTNCSWPAELRDSQEHSRLPPFRAHCSISPAGYRFTAYDPPSMSGSIAYLGEIYDVRRSNPLKITLTLEEIDARLKELKPYLVIRAAGATALVPLNATYFGNIDFWVFSILGACGLASVVALDLLRRRKKRGID